MSAAFDAYDQWLRHGFVAFNTELEEAYFAARSEILHGDPRLEKIKHALAVGASRAEQLLMLVVHETS